MTARLFWQNASYRGSLVREEMNKRLRPCRGSPLEEENGGTEKGYESKGEEQRKGFWLHSCLFPERASGKSTERRRGRRSSLPAAMQRGNKD